MRLFVFISLSHTVHDSTYLCTYHYVISLASSHINVHIPPQNAAYERSLLGKLKRQQEREEGEGTESRREKEEQMTLSLHTRAT